MLLRRSAALSFVAGAHVFPGGSVDDGDRFAIPDTCCDGLAELPRFPHLDAGGELACRVAAARELLEEAGVLLARRDGRWATTAEAEDVRRELTAGARFDDVLEAQGHRLALDGLAPFARVVTPVTEPRRFDTHFFVAELPPGAEARPYEAESDELVWATPTAAMEKAHRGELVLLPPTWVTLLQLEAVESVADLAAWAAARPLERVDPRLEVEGEKRLLSVPATGSGEGLRFAYTSTRGWLPVD
jgi:8-oxo-dGTP pyrophosphatase MutT (NUDIX family)